MAKQKKAPIFAGKLQSIMQDLRFTQKNIAEKTGYTATKISHICKQGMGDQDEIAKILGIMELPRQEAFELLVERNAEISEDDFAKKVWAGSNKAYVTIEEYLRDACLLPVERAYACAFYGISIQKLLELAVTNGIKNVNDLQNTDPWDFAEFVSLFKKEYGREATKDILSKQPKTDFPPVIMLDLQKKADPANYIKLVNCKGTSLFDLPHIVVSYYDFEKNGIISNHDHKGGIEFLCSQKGGYKLVYDGKEYPTIVGQNGPILIYDVRRNHEIRFVEGDDGRLIIVRFYPDKCWLYPTSKDGKIER